MYITCLLSTRHKLNIISTASSLGVFCSTDMIMLLYRSLYLYKIDSLIIKILCMYITCLLSTRHKLNIISTASSLGVFCSPDMIMFAISRYFIDPCIYIKFILCMYITCLLSTRHKLNIISTASSLGVFCSSDMIMFAISRYFIDPCIYIKLIL
jgi:glycerol-3-phosphate acyltransferase PlsY